MDTFGEDLVCGYDIGCRFKTTVKNSTLGQRAKEMRHTFVVDKFHGFAHNRLCQVDNLTTYCTGLGNEDFGGCERAFSKSNALSSRTRHMSTFRRRQAINSYFSHQDSHEVWLNLSMLVSDFQGFCILIYHVSRHILIQQLLGSSRYAAS